MRRTDVERYRAQSLNRINGKKDVVRLARRPDPPEVNAVATPEAHPRERHALHARVIGDARNNRILVGTVARHRQQLKGEPAGLCCRHPRIHIRRELPFAPKHDVARTERQCICGEIDAPTRVGGQRNLVGIRTDELRHERTRPVEMRKEILATHFVHLGAFVVVRPHRVARALWDDPDTRVIKMHGLPARLPRILALPERFDCRRRRVALNICRVGHRAASYGSRRCGGVSGGCRFHRRCCQKYCSGNRFTKSSMTFV